MFHQLCRVNDAPLDLPTPVGLHLRLVVALAGLVATHCSGQANGPEIASHAASTNADPASESPEGSGTEARRESGGSHEQPTSSAGSLDLPLENESEKETNRFEQLTDLVRERREREGDENAETEATVRAGESAPKTQASPAEDSELEPSTSSEGDDNSASDPLPVDAPADSAEPDLTLLGPASVCPEFSENSVTFTVEGVARNVQLFMDVGAAANLDGPLVFYWYGTGGRPSQALQGLGQVGVQRIRNAGGIVAAPVHNNEGVFPWIGGGDADLLLMDAIVACAEKKVGIDTSHIHSLGFSAGALFTASSSFARSNYLASVATYSGGGRGTLADLSNRFPAMILHGGPNDVVGLSFQTQSEQYRDSLQAAGHFVFICDHGGGHRIPRDAVASVVQFFFDHPFGSEPSPYFAGLPSSFPAFCTL